MFKPAVTLGTSMVLVKHGDTIRQCNITCAAYQAQGSACVAILYSVQHMLVMLYFMQVYTMYMKQVITVVCIEYNAFTLYIM